MEISTTTIQLVIGTALSLAVPLIIGAFSGLFSERAGIINIAIEGLMIVGAFTSAIAIISLKQFLPIENNIWIYLIVAIISGF
jgi:ABC-type uncharacterized transport system permease subunit